MADAVRLTIRKSGTLGALLTAGGTIVASSLACAGLALADSGRALRAGEARAGQSRAGALPDLRVAKGERNIAEAWLVDPTTRYQHYVLGSAYEAGGLAVRLKDGRVLRLVLPQTAVFEDRAPRLADLDGDGLDEIVVVKADLSRGASLAVVAVRGNDLQIIAETPPTGRANTWRNPAGIADFDGDGRLDIAEVQMPHVLGQLRLWTWDKGGLTQIATVGDTSNHKAGLPYLNLSAAVDVDGDGVPELVVPSLDRRTLRVLSFKGRAVREVRRFALPKPAARDLVVVKRDGVKQDGAKQDGALILRVSHEDGQTTDIRF